MVGSYFLVSVADNPPFPAPSSSVQSGDVGDAGPTRELLDPGDKGPKTPELTQPKGEGKPCDSSWLDVLVGAKTRFQMFQCSGWASPDLRTLS